MANQQATLNFVVHDANGNPQYIKLQANNASKTVKTIPQEAVKTILTQKSGTVAQVINATGTVIPPGAQVLRALSIQGKPRQLVTIPVQTSIQSLIKTERTPVTPKQVQISNSQPVMIQTNSPKTYVTTLLDHTGMSRKRQENENDFMPEYNTTGTKRRKTEKGGKGLRHFSMKVCEKVRKKGTTSYNEVADELVAEFTNPNLVPNSVDQQYDQKNIRRRVYDALNVLMAMNIISKEKKEIRWLGLPTNSTQESVSLISEKKQIAERIKQKTQQLNTLILQQVMYKNLIQRNFDLEKLRGPPPMNTAIQLPFIVVNSDRKTIIDCSITNDKTEYRFVFNDKFEIHDDYEILKQIGLTMGLDKSAISESDLAKVKSMFPKGMEKYIIKMATEKPGTPMNGFDSEQLEFVNCNAGPSSDRGATSDQDSQTSDEESNISTDIELN